VAKGGYWSGEWLYLFSTTVETRVDEAAWAERQAFRIVFSSEKKTAESKQPKATLANAREPSAATENLS